MAVPITRIGLLYHQGYFRQLLAQDGSRVEAFFYNDPDTMPLLPARDTDGSSTFREGLSSCASGRPMYAE